MAAFKTKSLMAVAASALFLASCGGDGTSELQNPGNTGSNPGTGNGGNGGTGGNNGGSNGACPTHPNVTRVTVGTEQHCRIEGEITQSLTLTNGPIYQLAGTVKVGKDVGFDGAKAGGVGVVLNIDAGVRIYAANPDTQLAVQRGSRINALGTAAQPIVMTSANAMGYGDELLPAAQQRAPVSGRDDPYSAEWGGLSILGRGVFNNCPAAPAVCEAEAEGASGPYGGNVPNDSSGALRYVRVEYAGKIITGTNELNSIAFYAVGSGTTVDYVQTHNGADDAMEFFGGSVNAKHLVLTGADDDSLDWTFGWSGKVQHVVIAQNPLQRGSDAGFEADNNEFGVNNTPRSSPIISNVTLVSGGTNGNIGVLLRRGTAGKLYNVVISSGWLTAGLDIDGADSYAQAASSALLLRSFYISATKALQTDSDDGGLAALYASDPNNRTGASTLTSFVAGGRAYINGVNENAVTAVNPSTVDPFFDSANYVGAVRDASSNWTLNWTRWLND